MINRIIRLSILSAVLCVAVAACKNSDVIQAEDFEGFYQRFLTDEEFQMSRIDFPLEGCETSDDDTVLYWDSAEDWTLLTGSIHDVDSTEYRVEKIYLPAKVAFKMYIEDSGFSITQEYELQDGEWFLVTYDSMSN